MKKLLFLLSLAFALFIAAPQADAGPPGDVQHVCLSVDTQTAHASVFVLATLPVDSPLMFEQVSLIQSPAETIITRAVTLRAHSCNYDPPNIEMDESGTCLHNYFGMNHQKISVLKMLHGNEGDTYRTLDPPHY